MKPAAGNAMPHCSNLESDTTPYSVFFVTSWPTSLSFFQKPSEMATSRTPFIGRVIKFITDDHSFQLVHISYSNQSSRKI